MFGINLGFSQKKSSSESQYDKNYSSQYGKRSSTAPIINEDWARGYREAGDTLGGDGFNATQRGGLDVLKGIVANNPAEMGFTTAINSNRGAAGGMNYLYSNYLDPMIRQPNYQLTGDTPQVNVGDVTAKTAADYMGAYKNPWEQDVVNTTGADLEEAYNRVLNRNKAAAAAGGAFGGGGAAIENAQATDDYLRNRASTLAQIRSLGFTTGAQLGAGDASRVLQADQGNQSKDLSVGAFNANMQNARDMANLDANFRGDQARSGFINQGAGLAKDAAGLDTIAANLGLSLSDNKVKNALALLQSGQIGWDQFMQYLDLGRSTFGTESDESGEESGQESGSEKGSSKGSGIGIGASDVNEFLSRLLKG